MIACDGADPVRAAMVGFVNRVYPMVDYASKHAPLLRQPSPFQPYPGSVGLSGLVELLTVVPLEANPHLCKVISLPMPLDEIVNGRGEIFEIGYAAS
jgi:hypothetical protein